jgi:hypothetical protein
VSFALDTRCVWFSQDSWFLFCWWCGEAEVYVMRWNDALIARLGMDRV